MPVVGHRTLAIRDRRTVDDSLLCPRRNRCRSFVIARLPVFASVQRVKSGDAIAKHTPVGIVVLEKSIWHSFIYH
jgi:hypothetical protein